MFAARRSTSRSLQDGLYASLQILIMYTLASVVLGAEMCTKSVPVQREPSKKVHVLRRVPASCSNWEKAWSWITKKDCGTKYRMDLVDLPSQKVVTYRMTKVCCEGDTKCKEAEANGLEASGLDVSDEKFLAIVLGSTAAALFVLILVISISLCRKKKQCTLLCEERRHIYASAEDQDESSELHGQKGCGAEAEEDEEETENKVCGESEYAEINDSGLPRYTDIFKEEDPFTKATAPPIASYESRAGAGDGGGGRGATDDSNVKEVLQGTADILERESRQQRTVVESKQSRAADVTGADDADYYNVTQGEARKKDGGEGGAGEEAVLSLTKDDPAVLTGGASGSSAPSSSSSQSNNPHHHHHLPKANTDDGDNNSTSCDVSGSVDRTTEPLPPLPSPSMPQSAASKQSEDKKSCSPASAYESLAHHGDKDDHEYQRLINRKGKGAAVVQDTEMNGISKDAEEVGFMDDDYPTILTNGHAESTADC
ncbi:uncharacterized protein [Littorina saxatilis]